VIVLGENHARRILDEYVRYYDEERTHQALDGDSPLSRVDERSSKGTVPSLALSAMKKSPPIRF
jgi:hypothetical protein